MPLPALIAAAQEIEIEGVFSRCTRTRALDLKNPERSSGETRIARSMSC
jgi:hypothetical protein